MRMQSASPSCTALVELVETDSDKYADRTRINASQADLTVAIALDFSTRGEVLTARVASGRYLALPFGGDPVAAARVLYRAIRGRSPQRDDGTFVLNVAGNGLHTFDKFG